MLHWYVVRDLLVSWCIGGMVVNGWLFSFDSMVGGMVVDSWSVVWLLGSLAGSIGSLDGLAG